jgi:hypothetical protein
MMRLKDNFCKKDTIDDGRLIVDDPTYPDMTLPDWEWIKLSKTGIRYHKATKFGGNWRKGFLHHIIYTNDAQEHYLRCRGLMTVDLQVGKRLLCKASVDMSISKILYSFSGRALGASKFWI